VTHGERIGQISLITDPLSEDEVLELAVFLGSKLAAAALVNPDMAQWLHLWTLEFLARRVQADTVPIHVLPRK
jgi:hypothetical protein